MYLSDGLFFKEHEKPNVTFSMHFVFRAEVEGFRKAAEATCCSLSPYLSLLCSAASKEASGATAGLVAGGRVLIIRASTGPCLCPQL